MRLGPLIATDLCFRRVGRAILDHVSLIARPGQALGIIGPSGSGKSTLLALLAGLDEPDSGSVHRDPPNARIGLVLQSYGLANLLTAAENVEIALQPQLAGGSLNSGELRRRAAAQLDAVGLGDVSDHLVEELSGGQQQRVAIARALVIRPDILIADEFAAELDRHAKQHALNLILDQARNGSIVLLATHDPEIAGHCDHVLRLTDGRLHNEEIPLGRVAR